VKVVLKVRHLNFSASQDWKVSSYLSFVEKANPECIVLSSVKKVNPSWWIREKNVIL